MTVKCYFYSCPTLQAILNMLWTIFMMIGNKAVGQALPDEIRRQLLILSGCV
ncbi:hypothetical protein Pan54_26550 [Rubinisphaera italica]|uniref:Uncharacterized protein n=1 Tax=Rubinisphaera italica TaxID=2527969 RepID=A0A5C5XGR3_9PLAN|nr:hypothetical protein Pan54_26550 [Rubinisphaera italica]